MPGKSRRYEATGDWNHDFVGMNATLALWRGKHSLFISLTKPVKHDKFRRTSPPGIRLSTSITVSWLFGAGALDRLWSSGNLDYGRVAQTLYFHLFLKRICFALGAGVCNNFVAAGGGANYCAVTLSGKVLPNCFSRRFVFKCRSYLYGIISLGRRRGRFYRRGLAGGF